MSFLSRLFNRNATPDPLIDSVSYNAEGVTRREPSGRMTMVLWSELREVAVMSRRDVHGLPEALVVLNGAHSFMSASAAVKGFSELIVRLASLSGFDHATLTDAMSRTNPQRTVCWRPEGMPAIGRRTNMGIAAGSNSLARARASAHVGAPALAPRTAGGAIRLDIAPTRATAPGYASDTVRLMQQIDKIDMDWSLASLAHVDHVLAEWHAEGAPLDRLSKSMYSLGCYAGQVLLLQAKGEWAEPIDDDPQDFDDLFLSVFLEDGREWNPIALCIRALTDGPETSLLRSARALLQCKV